jgi:S-disulfanyl-L-cysteine oxidoreductase SoxD
LLAALMVAAAIVWSGQAHAQAQETPLTHLRGVNDAVTETFAVEAEGPWALTLAAFCSEGFGYVEATAFTEDGERIGVVTVMGEGIERTVVTAPAGRYYVEVYASYKNVYDWELLVEEGEGRPYAIGQPLYAVSHQEHQDAEAHGDDHEHGEPVAVPESIWDGVFTAEQAQRGGQLFEFQCAACHGSELVSADGYAPDLVGFRFNGMWHGKTLGERFETIQTTMPLGKAGSLSADEVVDIIAFILSYNDYPAGDTPLAAGQHLEQIEVTPRPQ